MKNKAIISTFLLALLLIGVLGCKEKKPTKIYTPENNPEFWTPTQKQISKAKEIASKYAVEKLKVSSKQMERMKFNADGWLEDDRKILYLQFFDPESYPDWEDIAGMLGGFPSYFTISVDILNWTVVDHYACEE